MDVILPAGHGLRFLITDTGEDYLAPACGTACVVHVLPSLSTFEAPIIDRTDAEILITPQSEEAANNQYLPNTSQTECVDKVHSTNKSNQ